jgi:hypothetical protein
MFMSQQKYNYEPTKTPLHTLCSMNLILLVVSVDFFHLQFVWISASGHVKSTHLLLSAKNMHVIHAQRIALPAGFDETMNSKYYTTPFIAPFCNKMSEEENEYGYFMQDNATAHSVKNSLMT